MFLKSSQGQGDACVTVSLLIKLQASDLQLYLKNRLWHRCFPVNFAKFLRTPFLQSNSGRLLLGIPFSQFIPGELSFLKKTFSPALAPCLGITLRRNNNHEQPWYRPRFIRKRLFRPATLLVNKLRHRYFLENLAKYVRTPKW